MLTADRFSGQACSKGATDPCKIGAGSSILLLSTVFTGSWSKGKTLARQASNSGSSPDESTAKSSRPVTDASVNIQGDVTTSEARPREGIVTRDLHLSQTAGISFLATEFQDITLNGVKCCFRGDNCIVTRQNLRAVSAHRYRGFN
jgi:hypothetical protein